MRCASDTRPALLTAADTRRLAATIERGRTPGDATAVDAIRNPKAEPEPEVL